MADTKITALTALTAADPANDVIPIVDVSDTSMAASGTTKKISVNNILGASGTATLASATITGDLTVRTNKLKVDATGVGIGTASPSSGTLNINSHFILLGDSQTKIGDNGLVNGVSSDGNSQIQFFGGRSLFFNEGASNTKMTLNSTGLGIGVTPTDKLTLQSATDCALSLAKTSGTNKLYIITDGTTGWLASTSGTTGKKIAYSLTCPDNSLTLDASGNLLVGKTARDLTTAGVELLPSGQTTVIVASSVGGFTTSEVYSTTAAAYRFYVGMNGTVSATNTVISAISDARFKENVQDIDVGLAAILSLKPRKFDWKSGKGKDIKGDRGFIAQEFETVFPNLIDEWKDPAPEGEAPYKSVRQDLIPVLVKAIQELTARVQTLEAR